MELFIGGMFAGKLEIVKELHKDYFIYQDESFEALFKIIDNKPDGIIINNFHLIIRKMIFEGISKEEIKSQVELIINSNIPLAIISDEIGNGIVPIEKKERIYRELVGRLLIEIATNSQKVGRITCGILIWIK